MIEIKWQAPFRRFADLNAVGLLNVYFAALGGGPGCFPILTAAYRKEIWAIDSTEVPILLKAQSCSLIVTQYGCFIENTNCENQHQTHNI